MTLVKLDQIVNPAHPGYVSTRYYYSAFTSGISNSGVSTNFMYFTPIFIAKNITIDTLGINVTTAGAAGSLAKIGIYTNLNGNPDALLVQGEVSIAVSGAKTVTVANTLIPTGWYWLATAVSAGCSVSCTNNNIGNAFVGMTSLSTNNIGGLRSTFVYATLPNAAPLTGLIPLNFTSIVWFKIV